MVFFNIAALEWFDGVIVCANGDLVWPVDDVNQVHLLVGLLQGCDNSLHNDENYYHFLCFNHSFDSPANIIYYIMLLLFLRGGFLSILVLSTR